MEKEDYRDKFELQVENSEKKEEIIDSLEEQLKLKNKKIENLTEQVVSIQKQAKTFRHTLNDTLSQITSIKSTMVSLRTERDELAYERDSLKQRAAVGFEELTPRPNYKKIMQEKKAELNIKTDPFWRGTFC